MATDLFQNITYCKLISLNNLIDFIITRLIHRQLYNLTFLLSDGQGYHTTEGLRVIEQATGVSARLRPAQVWALQTEASLHCKFDAVQRFGNLQVDTTQALSLLGLLSLVSVKEGLMRALAV